ncbi:FlgB family protein [Aliiroseovarius sp. KMU-50]|uniref:FlgB family protein n=1 Tax=Aliiroseovarius salicola TaxID=3009082 RepID=A0ABT4W3L9_9RHOB|nr:FlgB family protein [Aliiroseovarius sp. KMU-50]MDA5095099.1 FlgB family protein [Aliiroseovarius sp. KMU-50]
MFDKLDIFRMSQGLAQHAAARQSTIAQNVANADTPGYRARDLDTFSNSYDMSGRTTKMRSTRAGHSLASVEGKTTSQAEVVHRKGATSPNGNSVSLELEMMASAEAKRDHDLALAIYRSSMNIMRASVGRK